jgi:hypothetical protein
MPSALATSTLITTGFNAFIASDSLNSARYALAAIGERESTRL